MHRCLCAAVIVTTPLIGGCFPGPPAGTGPSLVGAWRADVAFKDGMFASIKDLEFMVVFNQGGTMTESSNYDAVPPVPPAYGTWREVAPRELEARYEFFTTRAPAKFDEIAGGGGWMPSGHGAIVERIRLAQDGKSYESTLMFDAFDAAGKPVAGGGSATVRAVRIGT